MTRQQLNDCHITTSAELLELIQSEPDADKHIFKWKDKWHVTQEWLVGSFAGRSFVSSTLEDAAKKQIDYLNSNKNHNSIVGGIIKDCGWPDLDRVKAWLAMQRKDIEKLEDDDD